MRQGCLGGWAWHDAACSDVGYQLSAARQPWCRRTYGPTSAGVEFYCGTEHAVAEIRVTVVERGAGGSTVVTGGCAAFDGGTGAVGNEAHHGAIGFHAIASVA